MDSSKNGRWIITFKKFGMVRVNKTDHLVLKTGINKAMGILFFVLPEL